MQANQYTQRRNPHLQAATPALHATPSLYTDGLGLLPLPIYGLPCVIFRVNPGCLVQGDAGISRRCLARTQVISLSSPARVWLLPTQSLLPSRPTSPKICGRRPCGARCSWISFERAAHSKSGASQLLPQIAWLFVVGSPRYKISLNPEDPRYSYLSSHFLKNNWQRSPLILTL